MEGNRQLRTMFSLTPFLVLAFVFTGVIVLDRVNAQEVLEEGILEPEQPVVGSTTTEVPLKSAEQIFFELPYEVKYNLTLEKKEAADNLASKYAKLYDTCRFGR